MTGGAPKAKKGGVVDKSGNRKMSN